MRPLLALAVLGLMSGCSGAGPARRAPAGAAPAPAPIEDAGTPQAEATTPEPSPGVPEPDCAPLTGDAIARLREELRALSLAPWDTARLAAAKALCTLALGLEAGSPRPERGSIDAVRAQAALLGDLERLPFRHAAHVRTGLEAALDALDELAAARQREEAVPWLKSARRSVALVDPEGHFDLQRAAIQEAFRTVSAAFTIVTSQAASDGSPDASGW